MVEIFFKSFGDFPVGEGDKSMRYLHSESRRVRTRTPMQMPITFGLPFPHGSALVLFGVGMTLSTEEISVLQRHLYRLFRLPGEGENADK